MTDRAEVDGAATDRLVGGARTRIERLLEDLDHLDIEDVAHISLSTPDIARRAPARAAAVHACEAAGLGPLLEATRDRTRDRVIRMYDRNQYQPTWAGLNWGRSLGTVEDRVAVAAAVDDAVIGTVAADIVDESTVETLLGPMELLGSMHATDGATSQFAGTSWTSRTGQILFIILVATTVAVLGAYFGTIGWLVAIGIVIASILAMRRARETR